ncbi:MAG: dockerin type I domain-containing protein, partial [Planctomycetota bacterium]
SSFGEDAAGEIYFCDLFGGGVFRIDSEAAPPCLDVDGDGTVGVTDLSTLITQWGPCGGDCAVDFDGDGNVNTSDLVALILAWGPCH